MAQIDRATSQFLDAARWMSALAVVVAHVSALLIAGETPGVTAAPGLRAVVFLQNAGHLAVVIFFVVSGYLVGGQELLRVLDGGAFDARRYAIQRFSRIYTVLVPALMMTMAFDLLGQRWFDSSGIYTRPAMQSVGSLMYAIADRDGAGTLLGNLLMLQTILVEPLGGNGPLWSLANEWWYYVAFGMLLFGRGRGWWWVGGAVLVMAALPASIWVWSAVWLLGVGLAVLGRRWRGIAFGAALWLMAAGFLVALTGMRWESVWAGLPGWAVLGARLAVDLVAAAAFGLALLSAARGRTPGGAVHHGLAGFSYTLYAVHFPLLVLLGAAAHDVLGMRFMMPLGFGSVLAVVVFSGVIVGFAWCFAFVTERRTGAVRAALTRLSSRGPLRFSSR